MSGVLPFRPFACAPTEVGNMLITCRSEASSAERPLLYLANANNRPIAEVASSRKRTLRNELAQRIVMRLRATVFHPNLTFDKPACAVGIEIWMPIVSAL